MALEVASTNDSLRQATADVFDSWIAAATERIAGVCPDPARARELAISVIALLEGAPRAIVIPAPSGQVQEA